MQYYGNGRYVSPVQDNPTRFNTVGFSNLPNRYYTPARLARMQQAQTLRQMTISNSTNTNRSGCACIRVY